MIHHVPSIMEIMHSIRSETDSSSFSVGLLAHLFIYRCMVLFLISVDTPTSDSSSNSRLPASTTAESTSVQCHNLDFLSTSQETFPNVTSILLDPSCSGSGRTNNHLEVSTLENRSDPTYSNDRVRSLSDFQFKALQHATNTNTFRNVRRVVY